MKRKKQIVRNIILIALTALLFLWQGGYHLTPEAVVFGRDGGKGILYGIGKANSGDFLEAYQ